MTNQVTSSPSSTSPHPHLAIKGKDGALVASLGNTWAHAVGLRLVLTMVNKARQVAISKCSFLPGANKEFILSAAGFADNRANQY